MEKSSVHVLVSRDWFDDMFIKGDAKQNKIETYEAFEACAASVGIVIKFTSALTLDDGFVFVHPRWVTNADKEEYADKFAYIVDNENEFIVRSGHMYVDPFRMQGITIRTPFIMRQTKESIMYLESMYRKIVMNNPDVSNRYRDNCAVFTYMLTNQHESNMQEILKNKTMYAYRQDGLRNDVNFNQDKMFTDASSKVRGMMESFSKNKEKLDTYAKKINEWQSEMNKDGTSGYLNVQRAADNANRKIDEE